LDGTALKWNVARTWLKLSAAIDKSSAVNPWVQVYVPCQFPTGLTALSACKAKPGIAMVTASMPNQGDRCLIAAQP
jgi:hypothetical protein